MGHALETDNRVYRDCGAVRGFSLLEVLIGLLLASAVVLALYETLTFQQRSYFVQDEVSELQQNLRVALEKISRDLTMAGFGRPPWSVVNGVDLSSWYASSTGFFPIHATGNSLDIIGCLAPPDGSLSTDASSGSNTIILPATKAPNFNKVSDERPNKCNISIGGREAFQVVAIGEPSLSKVAVSLGGSLSAGYRMGTEVYVVRHTTYSVGNSGGTPVLRVNEHRGAGNQPLCQHITGLEVTRNLNKMTVTLTGRTRSPDRTTGKYVTLAMSTSVLLRNP